MSEPREPCFEEDFDCDTDPPEWSGRYRAEFTLEDIAIEKGHAYAQEHAPHGRVKYAELKEAYMQGFLQGFAHKMGGGHGDPL